MGDLGGTDKVSESLITQQISSLSVNDGQQSTVAILKDPRKIARKYQLDLCKKALGENTIAYLGTGCGKTHISVLLMYEMRGRIKKPEKDICIFLAPTVALVEQQARVIQDSVDFKVGTFCGNCKRLKSHHDWEKELEQHELAELDRYVRSPNKLHYPCHGFCDLNFSFLSHCTLSVSLVDAMSPLATYLILVSQVLVMIPQILLHNLCHCFIRMESIALLIFDECHYAQIESNHPYAEIMKVFYKSNVGKLPRIFGMTASPKHGKGASINSLETLLHAKVCSVEDNVELEQFISSPKVNLYYYGSATNSSVCSQHSMKLEEIKQKCFSTLSMGTNDRISLKNTKKALRKLHGNLLFCLENLGLWGAFQASRILLKGDNFARNELIEEAEGQCSDDAFCGSYLDEVASVFSSECMKGGMEADLSRVETLKVPFFSWKLLRLIGILSSFRLQPNMKCIIFVNRIITARSLAYVLCKLKILSSWRCHYLVGVNSGLKSMSRKNTYAILEKFRSGELNLLVATKVGEEGLDIQTCCLVIRFDLPETVGSFIQSRGRARMPQSEYAFLVDRWNEKEINLIQNFQKDEVQMNNDIVSRTSSATTIDFEKRTYKVESTGATITSGSSVALLHRYCSKLPHDEYFNPKPEFYFFDDTEGTVCHIILPANAPLHQIVSTPQSSIESAKKDACLKACKELHELGALSDFLLPGQDNDVSTHDLSDSDSDDGYGTLNYLSLLDPPLIEEDTRRELHEMLVPAVLKESWTSLENTVYLNSYFIKFSPHPADRDYCKFGLFLKTPLPVEASRMKLELLLACGRSVVAELIPSQTAKFNEYEIMMAEKFQELCLKVILDRSDMINDTVLLGENDFGYSRSSTFYLMLPVIQHDGLDKIDVDWKLVRKCVSSPVFRTPGEERVDGACHMNNCLHLANGPKRIDDIVNSLVYIPCKDTFFFVSDIVAENNGYSVYKESTNQNHVDHYAETFSIHLQYPSQPLLKAKQLFCLNNLLRKKGHTESRGKEEHFIELPPEICQLKIIGFSKDIGSSLSLLPSIMHRLESLLVAVELKQRMSASFPEGAQVSAYRVLEALTTEKCNERFSLERLEVLGDAFLKFAVGRRLFLLHDALDEGQLTGKRSNVVNNSNLFKLAVSSNLHVYVRDQSFDPCQFFALGRQCKVICTDETKPTIHSCKEKTHKTYSNSEIKCSKGHHWLHKKTVADVVEALVGVFIVDSGFNAATAFLKWLGIQVDFKASQVTNICSISTIFLPLSAQIDIHALENLLGYQFRHKGLLLQAFIHPSYNGHCGGCYQRLEFLGDAVLDYLITSYLYSVYPKLKPGQLTDLRSVSVNNNSFADIAVKKSFNKFLLCGETRLLESIDKYANFSGLSKSEKGLIEAAPCPKALGDVVESCVGAILLDSGFNLDLVWKIMLSFLEPVMKFSSIQLNPIRELQELCQFYDWNLKFPSVKKDGKFLVEGRVKGKGISSTAFAANVNKKAAKRMAAKQICSELKAQGYKTKAKSLEEVLKSSQKMEAQLIGYDENPLDTKPSIVNQFENLKLQEPSIRNGFKIVAAENVDTTRSTEPSISPVRRSTSQCESSGHQSKETAENNSCNGHPKTKGPRKISARSHLYELCAANCWKPPLLECCQETGPSHLKEFAYKVVVEIEDASNTILEAIGDPRPKKKDAAENAAEAALWYLKELGYVEEE